MNHIESGLFLRFSDKELREKVPIYSYNLERVLGYILLKLFLEHMYIRPMIVSTTNIFRPELRCVVFSEMDLSDVPI